jgi:hypothetical protein
VRLRKLPIRPEDVLRAIGAKRAANLEEEALLTP